MTIWPEGALTSRTRRLSPPRLPPAQRCPMGRSSAMTNRPAWSVPVRLSDLPADGTHRSIAADEATRAAVAREARVLGLPRLEADLKVTPRGRDRAHVRGTVSATVEQACVVTLDPL